MSDSDQSRLDKWLIRFEDAYRFVAMARAQKTLRAEGHSQEDSFNKLQPLFAEKYRHLQGFNYSEFVMDYWMERIPDLERALLPNPPFHFLRDRVVSSTMNLFSGGRYWLTQKYIRLLESQVPRLSMHQWLREDYVGGQVILNAKYLTSYSTTEHLYHLMKLQQATGCKLEDVRAVVEWGGGYGDMAKLFKRMRGADASYTIIDIPIVSCLQWLYLASVMGDDHVHLFLGPNEKVEDGKINLIPLCFLKQVEVQADLFVSTFALSESKEYAQVFVFERKWFDADHVLLAFPTFRLPNFPNGATLERLAKRSGLILERMPFHRGHSYALS